MKKSSKTWDIILKAIIAVCSAIAGALGTGVEKKVSFHVARHTAATLLLSLEVPIETVSKIPGHADIKMTRIYAKVTDKSKRGAVDKLYELTG